jgi:chitinase
MKWLRNLLWLLLLPGITGCPAKHKNADHAIQMGGTTGYNVVGYVAGYRDFDFSTIQAGKLTHINYAFANVIDGKVAFGTTETTIDDTELNSMDLTKLQALKRTNPRLKILVSVGGWVWSGHFSDVALTDESRKKFAASAVDFLLEYQLDGIDIDWEYPGQVGAGNTFREEDRENFTLLLKEVRSSLDHQSTLDGRSGDQKYLLTIASGADDAYFENTNMAEAHQYLDFINIMAYDFHNGLHHQTGHHANLRRSEEPGATGHSVLDAIDRHVRAGIPISKLNLGIPFYGRMWSDVPQKNNGLYQMAESTGSIIFYRTLISSYLADQGFQRYYDSSALAPYLWNADSAVFISYEDRESILKKMDMLKKKGMGGVMFWEYSDDHQSQLLNAVTDGLGTLHIEME